MSSASSSLPRQGRLAEHPLPRVLLALWRESFTGELELARDRRAKRIRLWQGAPVQAESNLAGDSLARMLHHAERIDAEAVERVQAHAREKNVQEAAAVLALKLLAPKELLEAMRDQLRQRLVEAFAWPDGSFALREAGPPSEDMKALRLDPLRVVQDGLRSHWSPDRLLAELEPHLLEPLTPGPRFQALAGRLDPGPETQELLETVASGGCFGQSVHSAPTPERLAAAWLLLETGALAVGAVEEAEDEAPGPAERGPDIEIEVRRTPAASEPEADRTAESAADDAPSAEAEGVRKEILDRHQRLGELDHYELLGVEPNAPDPAIKKAYFGLAKRFHPDAVARLGLSSIHREANELFARIAQAHQTLSNPKRRKAYDEGRRGAGPSNAAGRVAQAETLFRKGEVMVKVGNFNGALEFLRPCVELWPDEADYQGLLGWAFYKTRPPQPERALEHLERANALRGDDPVLVFRLGTVMRKLGRAEADALLERAKQLK